MERLRNYVLSIFKYFLKRISIYILVFILFSWREIQKAKTEKTCITFPVFSGDKTYTKSRLINCVLFLFLAYSSFLKVKLKCFYIFSEYPHFLIFIEISSFLLLLLPSNTSQHCLCGACQQIKNVKKCSN